MSSEIEDDEEGATQMMTARSLVGDETPDALDEEEGDLTVPFDRGAAFARAVARPRPAAGTPAPRPVPAPARPRPNQATTPERRLVEEIEPELIEPDLETGSITVPVARDELPGLSDLGETGEITVPGRLAPKAPEPRPVPRYDLPPPAYKPPPTQPPVPGARPGSRRASAPPPAPYTPGPGSVSKGYTQSTPAPVFGFGQAPTPPPMAPGPFLAQAPAPPPMTPGLGQVATPPPQGPVSAPVPSVPVPVSEAVKVRSPPVFIAIMVACTVLTVTGLLLLVYLKLKHFW